MRNVLISGGGIAGPALAALLERSGHDITVVESAGAPRPGGQAVDLRGAGRVVAERLGILPAVLAASLEQRGIAFVDARDRVRATMPVDAFGGEGIVSEIEILRGTLNRILLDASGDRVAYRYGDSIVRLDQDADGVDVEYASGSTGRFDLVIGADGVLSPVRRAVFGDGGYEPLSLATAWFTVPDPGTLDGWYRMYNAPGGRVASLRPGDPGEAKASLSVRLDPGETLPATDDGRIALLTERFASAGGLARDLVEQLPSTPDFTMTSVGRVRLSRWSVGRVALIGDAAACPSPLTGLGTTVALVQAYLLAHELACDTDHAAAFERYERGCRRFVESAQELPPGGVGGYAPMRAAAIRARWVSMGLMTRWPIRPLLERQFGKAADLSLPDPAAIPC